MKFRWLFLLLPLLIGCAKDYEPVQAPDPTAVPEKLNPFSPMTPEEKAKYGS
jgi:hypothetical protein